MNFPWYIAGRIAGKKDKGSISRPMMRIAVISTALGLSVMIVAVAIVTGFQQQIRNKVIGFGAHIQITNYDQNTSFETAPISKNQDFYPDLADVDGIRHIQVFATKPGTIKTDDNFQGVILKGIGQDFDGSFFNERIVKGQAFTMTDSIKSSKILISTELAARLQLDVDSSFLMYFIQEPLRVRKFQISGLYETGLEELDMTYIIGDIRHIQRLNNWDSTQVSGFEVLIEDFGELEEMTNYVYDQIGYDLDARPINKIYPHIFDWLNMMDMNVIIILVLMALVAAINMVTTLLIMILERTRLIGILKAMGTRSLTIRKIFLYHASYIVLKGLLWGNIVGISMILIQKHFKVITLDQKSYFVAYAPVNIDLLHILLLNSATMIICLLIMIIPSHVIARVSPVQAIRFK